MQLSRAQQLVVEHQNGPLLVLAGPGSGKTRVLTERIARLLRQDEANFHVLALTFTNKAANEMRQRLKDVDATTTRAYIGTIHSFCIQVLSDRGSPVGIAAMPNIFSSFADRKQLLVEAALQDPLLASELRELGTSKEQSIRVESWLHGIAEAKAHPISLARRSPSLSHLVEVYDSALRSCGAMDFDDVLLRVLELFETRPKIAQFYQRLYRYICVDEAQDLNEAQYAVLSALCAPSHKNLMLVGDPRQSIYGFNTSDPKYMDQFRIDFGAQVITLSENFRSARAIVSLARKLDSNYTVDGQLPIEGVLKYFHAENELAEAELIAGIVQRLVANGHPDVEGKIDYGRIAVLGRTRFVLLQLAEELARKGLPFYKNVAVSLEVESEAFREFELLLKVTCNPQDRLHLSKLLQSWDVSLSVDFATTVTTRDIFAALSEADLGHRARMVLNAAESSLSGDSFDLLSGLAVFEVEARALPDEERIPIAEDAAVWRKEWDLFLRSEAGLQKTVAGFLMALTLGTNQQPKQEGIALLTVHSSKGLEFDVVFVAGMADGVFPDFRSRGKATAYAEERRNLFVAATRSRRILIFTFPLERKMPWGDVWKARPSTFLTEVGIHPKTYVPKK
ncbi:MAG: ATP-dependent helicase [Burkholderiales bacterium]|nr:ATP-dependent helicase [Burkholderiales bacterium]